MATGEKMKICRICETYRDESSFQSYILKTGKISRRKVCKFCRSLQRNMQKQLKTDQLKCRVNKLKAVEMFGSKCSSCGGQFHPVCYDFHHKDDSTKKGNPSAFLKGNWDRAKSELDKCIMVCKNCHALIHFEYAINGGN